MNNEINMKEFVDSYLLTAAFVTCDSGENQQFTNEAKLIALEDCQQFISKVKVAFGETKAVHLLTIAGNDITYLAPHDLFLTRNRHGAGFWDRENIYGAEEAKLLTTIAHGMKEINCLHVNGKKSKLTFE